MIALIEERTWEQSALAKKCGVETRAIRRALDELTLLGVPLERDEENGSRVYWSVPKGWLPGARALTGKQVAECVRLLARLPRTERRDALLEQLLGRTPDVPAPDARETALRVLEDSVVQRVAARVMYRSTKSGDARERFLSVQRIAHGERSRFVALCHETMKLKWFRLDRADRAELDDARPYHKRLDEEVDAFVAGSFDGFRRESLMRCTFFVRDPEARWVVDTLPSAVATIERRDGGAAFTLETNGVDVLARYLVGLGDAVRIDGPEPLERGVMRLAASALRKRSPLRVIAPGERERNRARRA